MAEQSYREFLRRWEAGEFTRHRQSMCDAGWYDWFCTDRGLYGRLERMVPAVRRISQSAKVNLDTMYVFFKNNCPCWVDETYDDFRICDIATGDVLFTCVPRYPAIRPDAVRRGFGAHPKSEIMYVTEVWDFTLSEEERAAILVDNLAKRKPIDHDTNVVRGPRKEMYAYFGV